MPELIRVQLVTSHGMAGAIYNRVRKVLFVEAGYHEDFTLMGLRLAALLGAAVIYGDEFLPDGPVWWPEFWENPFEISFESAV